MNYRFSIRALAAVQLLAPITAGWLIETSGDTLPASLSEYLQSQPTTAFDAALGTVLIAWTLLTSVGLFLFWRPARWLFAAGLPAIILLSGWLPPVVQPAVASAILSFGMLAGGLLIGLVYFSPGAREFARRPTSETLLQQS